MPVNPIQLFENRTILVKKETTYGSDAAPTGAANAMVTFEGSVRIEADKLDRKMDRAFFGGDPFVLVGKRGTVEFDFDMIGHATVGTAAPISPVLQACGMAEVLTPATSAVYNPVSSGFASATVYFYHAGLLFKLKGARGTLSVEASIKGWPKAKARITGIVVLADIAEAAPGTVTLTAFQTPPAVETETLTVNIGAVAANAYSVSFDVGNDVFIYEGSEAREVSIRERMPTGQLLIFQEVLATLNPWTLANNYTDNDLSIIVSGGAGKIFTLDIDRAQFELPELVNQDGAMCWRIPFVAKPSGAGNDEFKFTFT